MSIPIILIFKAHGTLTPYLVDRPGKNNDKLVVSSLNGDASGTSLL